MPTADRSDGPLFSCARLMNPLVMMAVTTEMKASPASSRTEATPRPTVVVGTMFRQPGSRWMRHRLSDERDSAASPGSIADDGVGMDPARSGAGDGLIGMRDRVAAVGGTRHRLFARPRHDRARDDPRGRGELSDQGRGYSGSLRWVL